MGDGCCEEGRGCPRLRSGCGALPRRIIALGHPGQQRRTVQSALGDALTNAGRWGEAARLRLALAEEAEPVQALQLQTIAGEQLLCSGRFDSGAALLVEVLRAVHVYVPRNPPSSRCSCSSAPGSSSACAVSTDRLREGELPRELTVRIRPSPGCRLRLLHDRQHAGQLLQAPAPCSAPWAPATRSVCCGRSPRRRASRRPRGTSPRRRTLRRLARLRTLADTVGTPFARSMVGAGTAFFHYFVYQDYATSKSMFMTTERTLGELCVGQFWTRATARTMACHAMMKLGHKDEPRRAGHDCVPRDGGRSETSTASSTSGPARLPGSGSRTISPKAVGAGSRGRRRAASEEPVYLANVHSPARVRAAPSVLGPGGGCVPEDGTDLGAAALVAALADQHAPGSRRGSFGDACHRRCRRGVGLGAREAASPRRGACDATRGGTLGVLRRTFGAASRGRPVATAHARRTRCIWPDKPSAHSTWRR